jgi:hypothetical protein
MKDVALQLMRIGDHRTELVTSKRPPVLANSRMTIKDWSTVDKLCNGSHHENGGGQHYEACKPADDVQQSLQCGVGLRFIKKLIPIMTRKVILAQFRSRLSDDCLQLN